VFEVDAAGDTGDPRYGCQFGVPLAQLGGPITQVGACPIMQLLMFADQANTRPALSMFGEPLVGEGVELQGQSFPPNSTAWLVQGDWAPNSGSLGSCLTHIANPNPPLTALVDAFGRVRWGDLAIPLVPSMLSQVVGLQCVVPSTGIFSNALRVTIGGGL
jgi:hypothetical protein